MWFYLGTVELLTAHILNLSSCTYIGIQIQNVSQYSSIFENLNTLRCSILAFYKFCYDLESVNLPKQITFCTLTA